MKIRSITVFIDPGWPFDRPTLERAAGFIAAARPAYEKAGFTVQTARLATVPFPRLLPVLAASQLVELSQSLESIARAGGYEYVSLGPALPEVPGSFEIIPDAIAATQYAFFSGLMTLPAGGVSLPAVHLCGEVIARSAPISPDGFANLRFAALANVPPGAPFFPAAYHAGGQPAFALALEAADLAVQAFTDAPTLEQARLELVAAIERHARALSRAARRLERLGFIFGGLDFSLAPFPSQELSLGTAIERLGVQAVGSVGSLGAAAILADTIDRARFRRAGFNGLMLPVLEDYTLAQRWQQGTLTVKDLLLYSAVCGTGLDTIPLPGDTPAASISALLLDLAALAQRLDKPLTARLMPVPGKRAGDPTGFDFAFFANSRVMELGAASLQGSLAGGESFTLRKRK